MGFIAITVLGGMKQGGRKPTLYRFTDEDTYDRPSHGISACKATHDYQKFTTLDEARRALDQGVAEFRAKSKADYAARMEKARIRKVNRTDSKSEPYSQNTDSKNESSEAARLQKVNQAKRLRIARQAA
jgi:pyruvate/2-oxoacid:ferredoxin oxidoreductase beta subunit